MFALPIISFGQNETNGNVKQNDTIVEISAVQTNDGNQLVYTTVNTKVENYKKSNELTSIKAYRKSLQIKVKEIKNC